MKKKRFEDKKKYSYLYIFIYFNKISNITEKVTHQFVIKLFI